MDRSSVGMAVTKGHQIRFSVSVRSIYMTCFGLEPGTQDPLRECVAIPGLSIFPLSRCGSPLVLRSDQEESGGNRYLWRNFYSVISNTENCLTLFWRGENGSPEVLVSPV